VPTDVADIVEKMRSGSAIRFTDLKRVCDHFFGKPRINGSHHIYRTPWPGDPRVNIQREGGQAKRYQVRQILRAIDRLETSR
jgi:hypothetical protein